MFSETRIQNLLAAFRFASQKHLGQVRKNSEQTPYIYHPMDLVHILWEVGQVRQVSVLIAALLHDTLEDTQTQPDEISALFGEEVLSIVQEVTDDKTLPKHLRKQKQIELAAHSSDAAKLVKLADKISNLRDLVQSPPAHWDLERKRQYVIWCDKVVNALNSSNLALNQLYAEISEQANRFYFPERGSIPIE